MTDLRTFELAREAIEMLFPLHVVVSSSGEIGSIGPTVARILKSEVLGVPFFDVFWIDKPKSVRDLAALRERIGTKLILSLSLSEEDSVQFRAVATTLGAEEENLLIDLSLGSDLIQTVARFGLSNAHFRVNDPSIDLLYAFETQRTFLEESQRLAEALSKAKDEAERKAYIDPLTGLANRRALHGKLDQLLEDSDGPGPCALLQIDLDKFKSVNDTFGHAAGDLVLRHTALAMETLAADEDLPVRLGGDEFAMIIADASDAKAVLAGAEALRQRIRQPVQYEGTQLQVGASIGIVHFDRQDETSSDRLLRHGDIALYDAKATGNSVTVLAPEMIRRSEGMAEWIAEIRAGIETAQFVPFFQPQIDTDTGQVVGFEVLARWLHPQQGIVPPARFLDTAIRANLLDRIDALVRRQAIKTFAQWRRDGRVSGKISFNMTTSNLRSPTFVEELSDELLIAGVPASQVQLELLESILFDKADDALIQQCHAIRRAGFSLALDDFGTGHAAISTLIDVPVSLLKVDRSFVTGLDRNPKLRRITASILAMAAQIGLDVLAEGVESEEEIAFLQANGCHLFQGFHFSRPLDPQAMTQWLDQWVVRPLNMAERHDRRA